jgi:DNA repair protein RecO (recombination protein O)
MLTQEFGKISAIANNVRTKRSRMIAGLQLFAYSEVVLYKAKSKNGLYHIDEMNVLEGFGNIRTDLDKMAYASYFAEAATGAASEEEFDAEILRLLLNSLYAVDRGLCGYEKIKTVFEWRLAVVAGYAPQIENCGGCSCTDNIYGLSLAGGTVLCNNCAVDKQGTAQLSDAMRQIIEYIVNADSKQIFSFDAGETVVAYLSQISEAYLSVQLGREFKTLGYLKKVRGLGDTENAEKN